MSGTMSKRQQARNEKMLQELVHNVSGNNNCADCQARNPAWASWSLGVFLCMRCAAIHRKLGTHISKVKSLSMDSWSNEQVDNMRKVGNTASNQIYNPENKKPNIPIDADEADSAMERFIRQKYTNNVAISSGKPRSPLHDEGTPPPLPPKNSKFGFRSASSIFPLSSKAKREAKHQAALDAGHSIGPSAPPRASSIGFGAAVDGAEDTEEKLAKLRAMGFQDGQRNAMVLKGVNGNLERAVESLIRLGEGDMRVSPVPTAKENGLRTSRSLTPLTSNSMGLGAGLSVPSKPASSDRPITSSSASNNPFDAMGPAPVQTAQSTGTLEKNNPYSNNPFGAPSSQQGDTMTQAFQQMNLPTPQQPLFPHHTGGQPPTQQMMYQQPFVPSAPATPHQYQNMSFQHSMTYPQPMQQQPTSNNPFLSNTPLTSSQQQSSGLAINTGQTNTHGPNPFARSPTRLGSPTGALGQIPEQSPSVFQNSLPMQPTGTNPFFSSPVQSPAPMSYNPYGQLSQQPQQQSSPFQQPVQTPQQFQHAQQQQQQQQQYYQPPRHDKASIMALYGQPASTSATASPQPFHNQTIPEDQAYQPQPVQAPTQAAPTGQASHSSNPYLNNGASIAPDPFASSRQKTRESMNLGLDMAWTNGRHSPDAFASLSARQ